MEKHTIIADPRVKDDLKDAKEYLNSKRKEYAAKFLKEYKQTLRSLQQNPFFKCATRTFIAAP